MLAGVNRGSWCYITPTTLAIKPAESIAIVRIKVLARRIVYAALDHFAASLSELKSSDSSILAAAQSAVWVAMI